MLNYIIIIFVIFFLFRFYNALWNFGEQIRKNRKIENDLFQLSDEEILRLYYILKNPSLTAYFPEDDLFILTLEHNGFVTRINGSRKINHQYFSLDKCNVAVAFCFSNKFLPIIQNHKNEIISAWKNKNLENKNKIFKDFDKFQI